MKTLLLMRHAKSSWKDQEMADHERPLNKRGQGDAPKMGALLKEKELIPQRILCSTALRARSTAEAINEATGCKDQVDYLDSFYLAEPAAYLDGLRVLPEDVERVLVIGHNPGLETLLHLISGRIESLATSSVAYLALPIKTWQELDTNTQGELVQLWNIQELEPKEEKKEEKMGKGKKEKKEKKNKKEKKEKKEKEDKKDKKEKKDKSKGKKK